ncbi:MAG: UDP-glucose/GDP-mannose dehydrogenase family protein [Dehalococcoidia bacterium]|nr:UDP-glucose/GDP-mannose dehydrogenase family protein [Dehalococcoidia bacterium]
MMKVSIVGAGYVGLVTGVGLALRGHDVVVIDSEPNKVESIRKGEPPVFEPGLEELLRQVLEGRHFSATGDMRQALQGSDVIFICVETPSAPDGAIDLTSLKRASAEIVRSLPEGKRFQVIVVKSTVIPGTCEGVVLPLLKESGRFPPGLCMNPEFLRQGQAVSDFLEPDRIVIGELNALSGDLVQELYRDFSAPVIRTNLATAEMIKYASNTLLSTMVSFSNEIANICELIPQVDAREVLKAVHLDRRLSPVVNGKRVRPGLITYLFPGCGYGGSCLPKDAKALISYAQGKGYTPKLLKAVDEINQGRPLHLVDIAERALGGLSGRRIAILGLSFKPDTDDMRQSPAIPVVEELLTRNAEVIAYDPQALFHARRLWEGKAGFVAAESMRAALSNSDAVILVTAWDEFTNIPMEALPQLMRSPIIIDGRGIFDPQSVDKHCLYLTIGRGRNKKG